MRDYLGAIVGLLSGDARSLDYWASDVDEACQVRRPNFLW